MSRSFACRVTLVAALLAVAACHSPNERVPGNADDHSPWNGITAGEAVQFVGTEPFWGGRVGPDGLTYSTPENQEGEHIAVTRFAGRGGVSFSGTLEAGAMTLMVTPGSCSDGMSDARYPFTVTLHVGSEVRQGCGWTERQPRTGSQ